MSLNMIDTVVVGGGQAGLAISYYLNQQGREHVVLERAAAVANAWRNQRWDSFTLVTPNFQVRLPGAEYSGNDPYGFMSRAEIVRYFDAYVERFRLPVRCDVQVYSVQRLDETYLVRTSAGDYHAENVVVATGLYQSAKIPFFARRIPPNILQLHSMKYKNPAQLPDGAVLVVGTGQSGAQIAEELYQSGRKVYLSIGSAGRVPRRYRGRDINDWFSRMGMFDTKVHELKAARAKFAPHPQISGKNGGKTINLHEFARDGVVLLGRVSYAQGNLLFIAPDLRAKLLRIDEFETSALQAVDSYITRNAIDAPPETVPQLDHGYKQPIIRQLDPRAAGISFIIWATGYKFDFSMVKLPLTDSDGYPIQKRGVTSYQGLYFLGIPWLHSRKSGILFGVGEDAEYIANHIANRESAATKLTAWDGWRTARLEAGATKSESGRDLALR